MPATYLSKPEITALRAISHTAPKASDRDFAASLVGQIDRGKTLSPKQVFYGTRLVNRNGGPATSATRPDGTLSPSAVQTAPAPQAAKITLDLSGITGLFAKALASKLVRPKITFVTPAGNIVFSLFSDGGIFVSNGLAKGYGRKVYAIIKADGTLDRGMHAEEVHVQFIRYFAGHPVEALAKYGKAAGKCCLCSRKLSDDKSLSAGYGGTCAKNYGLPYGEVTEVLKATK